MIVHATINGKATRAFRVRHGGSVEHHCKDRRETYQRVLVETYRLDIERSDRMQGVVRVASVGRRTTHNRSYVLDEATGVSRRKGDASGEPEG
ncbi:hypothetical protein A2U01_0071190, partial [Trifolium medium]|nr:hypothetical protein [Trifolium medium]